MAAGLDDEDFLALEGRDDSGRTLHDLMREENMRISDILRLKKQYERQGIWDYKPNKKADRLRALANKKKPDAAAAAAAALAEAALNLAGAGGGSMQIVSKVPLPRTREVCAWKGYDANGNLYWCNNRVMTHPRTNVVFEYCGFHSHECVGAHPTGTVQIITPNEFALCYTHYVADHGRAPFSYENELLIPGVIFAREGTKKHALAPVSKKKKKSGDDDDDDDDNDGGNAASKKKPGEEDEEEEEDEFGYKKKKKKQGPSKLEVLFQRFLRAVKTPAQLRAEREKGAILIQSRVRSMLAYRVVERMKREKTIEARHKAALMMQSAFRRAANQKRRKRMFTEMHNAAGVIQRSYRYCLWKRKLERDQEMRRAAIRIQRWLRMKRMRIMLKTLHLRQDARAAAQQRSDGLDKFRKMVRVWKFHRVIKAARKKKRREDRAVLMIQRAWNVYKGRQSRSKAMKQRDEAVKLMRATLLIQKLVRQWIRRRAAAKGRRLYFRAARMIRRICRGHLGRLIAKRQRQRIEAVWAWLAPTLPREMYAEYLGFPDYDRMFDLSKFLYHEKSENDDDDENRKEGEDGEDEEDEAAIERRNRRRTEKLAMDGDTGGSVSLNVAKAFGTITGKSLKVDGAAIKKQVLKQIAQKEKAIADGLSAEARAMERCSKAPVPMGREHGPDGPTLMVSLTHVARSGRAPLQPPPKAIAETMADFEKKQMQRYIEKLSLAFDAADADCMGLLSAPTFLRVLTKHGADMGARLNKVLCETFAATGVGRVSYRAYIQFAKRLDRPCPVHRVLVCPACIYAGPCDKCLCKRYENEGDMSIVSNPHSELCTCGHHRNRHAPAMKVHPQPDPAKGREPPAAQAAKLKSSASSASALLKNGKSSSSLAGFDPVNGLHGPEPTFGDRAFLPLPLSIAYTVGELHFPGLVTADLQPGEHIPMQDMDDGLGSAVWRSKKEEEEDREARISGKPLSAASIACRSRVIHGAQIPNTIAVSRLESGRIAPLQPMEASKFAALEQLMDDVEYLSSAADGGAGHQNNKLRISDTLPMQAVAGMPLKGLRVANEELQRFAEMAHGEADASMKGMIEGSKAAIARSERAAAGADKRSGQGMSSVSSSNGGGGGGGANLRNALVPYDPPARTLYERAMDELEMMSDYDITSPSRGGAGMQQTFSPFHQNHQYNNNNDTHQLLDDAPFGSTGKFLQQQQQQQQKRFGSPPSARALSAVAVDGGLDHGEGDTLGFDRTTGSVVLSIPRMTPPGAKPRGGIIGGAHNSRSPRMGNTDGSFGRNNNNNKNGQQPMAPVFVPAMFASAMAAGADIASGGAPPTAQTTAIKLDRAERFQKSLMGGGGGSGANNNYNSSSSTSDRPRSWSPLGMERTEYSSPPGSPMDGNRGGGGGGTRNGGRYSPQNRRSPSPSRNRDRSKRNNKKSSASLSSKTSNNNNNTSAADALTDGTSGNGLVSATSTSAQSRAMFTYLLLLRTLALPSSAPGRLTYDIVSDPSRLLQLIIDHHAFLSTYWRDVVTDIRTGKLSGGPSNVLSAEQRRALGQILAPNPGRATFLDNIFVAQGFAKYRPPPTAAGGDLFFGQAYTDAELATLKDPSKPFVPKSPRRGGRSLSSSAGADEDTPREDLAVLAALPPGSNMHVGGLGSRAARAMVRSRQAEREAARGKTADSSRSGSPSSRSRSPSPLSQQQAQPQHNGHHHHHHSHQSQSFTSPYFSAPASGEDAAAAVMNAEAARAHRTAAAIKAAVVAARHGGRDRLPALDISKQMNYALANRNSVVGGVGPGGLLPHTNTTTNNSSHIFGNNMHTIAPNNDNAMMMGSTWQLQQQQQQQQQQHSFPPRYTHNNEKRVINIPAGMVAVPAPLPTDADRMQASRPPHPFGNDGIATTSGQYGNSNTSSSGQNNNDSYAFMNPATMALHPALAREVNLKSSAEKAADYTFYTIPGPRPYVCRHPACGQSFGSIGAAIRHLKTAHKGTLPLFSSSETDAYWKNIWEAAGVKAGGWVPAPPTILPVAVSRVQTRGSGTQMSYGGSGGASDGTPSTASTLASAGEYGGSGVNRGSMYAPADPMNISRPAATRLQFNGR